MCVTSIFNPNLSLNLTASYKKLFCFPNNDICHEHMLNLRLYIKGLKKIPVFLSLEIEKIENECYLYIGVLSKQFRLDTVI